MARKEKKKIYTTIRIEINKEFDNILKIFNNLYMKN